jgi:DNA-directed RNA polymerase specialized sigma24 family protein
LATRYISCEELDDPVAIERCRAGDKEAFRHLVERYQAEAMEHAVAILADREDALDAVQDAFFDAYQALSRFDTSRQFYPWFTRFFGIDVSNWLPVAKRT